jgi:2-keto-4-pentenoate hydratase/2-oxohepta-3-ene-1,7-dioic acid hydratase in catechol pathway
MHLIRAYHEGKVIPAILDEKNKARSLKGIVADISAEALGDGLLEKMAATKLDQLELLPETVSPAPCLTGIGKIIAIGKNYSEHAKEVGTDTPTEPILFMKATSALSGANDPIIRPRASEKLDWEVELGVIIGKSGNYIDERNALDYIAGYCTANDVSERSFQTERAGQWTKGKSADSFCPLGPYFVSKDAVPNPHALRLWTEVNGVRMQDGHTKDMTFKIPFLISYISQFMGLQPGDVLLTGTPAGVGKGRTPPLYLKPGDEMRCGVEGLGEQKHKVVDATAI